MAGRVFRPYRVAAPLPTVASVASDGRERKRPRPTAFVSDFVDVALPIGVVRSRLDAGGCWLAPLAAAAGAEGDELLVRLGPAGVRRIGPDIRIRLGPPVEHDGVVVVPMRWEASMLRPIFPVLDGDLQLAPLDVDRSRVVLHASYRVPLDVVGQLLDHALLHRVAESTIRSFLRGVGERLIEGRSDEPGSTDGPRGSAD